MTIASSWPARFEEIRREFGYDVEGDEAAARALSKQVPFAQEVWAAAAARIRGQTVFVVGAGDSARDGVSRTPSDALLISADGATTAVRHAGRWPLAIVTDLDGAVADQVDACRHGSLVFVHAHADNRAAVAEDLRKFDVARVAGTCQVQPIEPLRNVGGFTDGDRAVFLALSLGAKAVRLVGFDLTGPPGRYSGRYDAATKGRKLEWAQRILGELIDSGAPVTYV